MKWQDAILFSEYDYNIKTKYGRQNKRGQNVRYYQDVIITLDTETTKYNDDILFITDWSITIENNATVYGHRVYDLIETINKIAEIIIVNDITRLLIYVHNFSYDYMFIRNHALEKWGKPIEYLATKTHRYVYMLFANGIEFRDSYILTQKSLDKLCKDMGVTNKASGKWDYNKFRTPNSERTEEEKEYFLTDTIALNEALRKFFSMHKVNNATVEYTSTGFIRKRGYYSMLHNDKDWNRNEFKEQALTLEQYRTLLDCYHGGYTHANRFCVSTIFDHVESYDFSSSYPSVMCYEKFPMHGFNECTNISIDDILKTSEDIAYFGYCTLSDVKIKKLFPMPVIQQHKLKVCINGVFDNGKLISADFCVFPFTDPDLYSILLCYDYSSIYIGNCYYTVKDFLPSFITHDLIMPLFYDKCTLKGVDDVNYMISKSFINGIYGMSVQRIIQDEITEDFNNGEWEVKHIIKDDEKAQSELSKFYKKHNKYLPYQWGCWVTAYAQRNLFKLGLCAKEWIYSDTDSVKATAFDYSAIENYNNNIRKISKEKGLGTVNYNGKEFTLGIAEREQDYDEFITLGSKRYCYRQDNKLHITVAGVPKQAAIELEDDITRFNRSMIFCKVGSKYDIEKNTAVYIVNDGIKEITLNGEVIEYGSAVRLDRVEYSLDSVIPYDPETGLPKEIELESII